MSATKLGLEARVGGEITETKAILEWMIGDDGRTACSRVRHNCVHGKVCELAGVGQAQEEQQAVVEEGSFGAEVSRCHTWVGYYDRSNEHTKEGWKLRSWSFYLVQKIHKII